MGTVVRSLDDYVAVSDFGMKFTLSTIVVIRLGGAVQTDYCGLADMMDR